MFLRGSGEFTKPLSSLAELNGRSGRICETDCSPLKLLELLEPVSRFVYSKQAFREISDAEYPDRLGKRELALRHLACAVRFCFLVDWKLHLFQTCIPRRPFVSSIFCGSLHFLDVLPTRIAPTNIGCRTENGNTRSRGIAAARFYCPNRSGTARQSGEDNLSTASKFAVANWPTIERRRV